MGRVERHLASRSELTAKSPMRTASDVKKKGFEVQSLHACVTRVRVRVISSYISFRDDMSMQH